MQTLTYGQGYVHQHSHLQQLQYISGRILWLTALVLNDGARREQWVRELDAALGEAATHRAHLFCGIKPEKG